MTITSGPASSDAPQALAVVVMGVAGAGKTTVGLRLAEALRGQFIDGDDLHTEEARAKMSRGQPLTDEDRWPWLDRIAAALSDGVSRRRDDSRRLIGAEARLPRPAAPARRRRLALRLSQGDRELMRARVAGRRGHYMPASLVDSQFATLEPPDGEPDVIVMPADADLDAAIPELAAELKGR